MRKRLLYFAPLALVGFIAFIFVGGLIVRALWNWLMPSLFGLRELGFWQALGLLALCRILFGGFRLHGNGGAHARRRMSERWEVMTPEERERFRQSFRGRCGFGPEPEPSEPDGSSR